MTDAKLRGLLRSIVLAGVVIAAPLVMRQASAEPVLEQAKADSTKLDKVYKQIPPAMDAVAAARTDTDRTKAKAKLDQLHKDKASLEQRLTKALEKFSRDLQELDDRIAVAASGVAAAQTDAGRIKTKAKLDQLRNERLELTERWAAVRPVTAASIHVKCRQALLEKRWTDATECANGLRFADKRLSDSIRTKSMAEANAEVALRTVDDAIAAKNLTKAKAALETIAKDSVYRPDAQAKYDAAIKAQK